MASQTRFKQACPSCDHPVPIRDASLIGRKVICPMCKDKFIVEDPSGDEAEAAPVRKSGKAKAGKKKSGSNTMLYVCAGVGLLAVVALAVGGFIMMSGDSKPTASTAPRVNPGPTSAPSNDVASNPPSTPDAGTAPPLIPSQPANMVGVANNGAIPVALPQASYGDISNLLPNDCQGVLSIHMDKLRYSTFGQQAFESQFGFRAQQFKDQIGVAVEDMQHLVRGENLELSWAFNILRTNKPVNMVEISKAMGLKKGAKSPIQGREYFELPPNDLLDNLGMILRSEFERELSRIVKKQASGPLCLVMLDPNTMVFANADPLEEFLNANCKFKQQSKPSKKEEDSAPGGNQNPGGRGGKIARGMSNPIESYRHQDPAAPADGDNAMISGNSTYLTVDPPLKAMMDKLETDAKDPPIMCLAVNIQVDPRIGQRIRGLMGIDVPAEQLPIRILGVQVSKYELEKLNVTAAVEIFNENDAKGLEEMMKTSLPNMAQIVGLILGGIKVEVDGDTGGSAAGGRGGRPGRPGASGAAGGEDDTRGFGGNGNPTLAGPPSKIKLTRKTRTLLLNGDFNLPQLAYIRVFGITESFVSRMKGMVDMASPSPRWPEMIEANAKLRESGLIPRGTFPRSEGTGTRLARSWPPHHRVSWMAGLLPFLGQATIYQEIERDKHWREEKNLKAGSVLIPEFLDPRYPRRTWRAQPGSLGRDVGATHYVGIAGVGVESTDYKPGDAATAKKLGVFGYDRTTNMKDVTDGAANTIYMLEVPPSIPRPWIAGGGATVMGVPEEKPMRPFSYLHGRKQGTYALMLDGTVRFISSDISEDIFKALCTIKGGETIADLDAVAPKVNPKAGPVLKTEDADKKDDKKDEEKKDEEKKDDKPEPDKDPEKDKEKPDTN